MSFFWICLFTVCFAYVLTPPVIALSWHIGAVDVPCDWRRMHHVSVARGGGIAIFLSFFVGTVLLGSQTAWLAHTLAGGFLILLLGLIDDLFCLRAIWKLLFQAVVAFATLSGLTDGDVPRMLLGILWVLLLINAHNFVDGLDGLLSGCAGVEASLLSLLLICLGQRELGMSSLLLGLACWGFRRFNRFPAQIFAGDCGSESVGFLLAMLSFPLFAQLQSPLSMFSPILIFAYPLTDLGTAVIRRILRGKSPFLADRGHLHHRICAAGVPQVACVGVLLLLTLTLGIIGFLIAFEGLEALAMGVSLALVLLLMKIRRFIVDFA